MEFSVALLLSDDQNWLQRTQEWLSSYDREYLSSMSWKPELLAKHFQLSPDEVVTWSEDSRISSVILFKQTSEVIDIHYLYTLKNDRRKGHMKALLQALIVSYPDHKIWLEVSELNSSAVDLYRGEGFAQVGERGAYYGGRERALLFST